MMHGQKNIMVRHVPLKRQ